MARIKADYVFGVLDAAIASGDTTISSSALTRLPAVSGGDVAAITLGNSSTGVYEIVHVTAHTASATTATILRGREGTTAAAWALGQEWMHAPTVTDFATTFPAGGSAGQRLFKNSATDGDASWRSPYAAKAICSTDKSVTTTTASDVAGMTQTITVPGTWARYYVTAQFDLQLITTSTSTFVGTFLVDGTVQTGEALVTIKTVGERSSGFQTYLVTGLSAGSHTFKSQAKLDPSNSGEYRVWSNHSALVVVEV